MNKKLLLALIIIGIFIVGNFTLDIIDVFTEESDDSLATEVQPWERPTETTNTIILEPSKETMICDKCGKEKEINPWGGKRWLIIDFSEYGIYKKYCEECFAKAIVRFMETREEE